MKSLLRLIIIFFICLPVHSQENTNLIGKEEITEKQPKVSVVIPIYNDEKYINQCLDSILNQTYKNLEVILVDDHSTDNTYKILSEYAKNDSRIKLYRNALNVNNAEARNIGMKYATGDYLYFIDDDDFIDENYLKELVDTAEKNNADIVVNNNIIYFTDSEIFKSRYMKYYSLNENFFSTDKRSLALYKVNMYVWNKLFKIDFIRSLGTNFSPKYLIYSGDAYFIAIALSNTNLVFGVNSKSKYYHTRYTDSLTGNSETINIKKRSKELLWMIAETHRYLKKNKSIQNAQLPIFHCRFYLRYHEDFGKEEFYKNVRELFNSIKEDILNNKQNYRYEDLRMFNDILKYNNYRDYIIHDKIISFVCFLTISVIMIFCLFTILIFCKITYLISMDIVNYFKKRKNLKFKN